jgi:hypothetical protein
MTAHATRYPVLVLAACLLPGACGEGRPLPGTVVESSGKEATGLAAVPEEVLQAAHDARPELELASAEHEVRNGRNYYDLAGKMPDESELELDLTTVDGAWTVVEIQRDVSLEQLRQGVHGALTATNPGWVPTRIIESDQNNGIVIYEFFGPDADGSETKVEVKWEAGTAEVLRDEWLH